MTTLKETMVERRMFVIESNGDEMTVALTEGACSFAARHPVLTTVAAGYLINKAVNGVKGTSTINVTSNTFKFYARNATERKLQKELVDLMVASKHYSLLRTSTENGAYVWTLRRRPR